MQRFHHAPLYVLIRGCALSSCVPARSCRKHPFMKSLDEVIPGYYYHYSVLIFFPNTAIQITEGGIKRERDVCDVVMTCKHR